MYDSYSDERSLMELVEVYGECDDDLIDRYIEAKKYQYREEWFAFLEVLDKE